MILGVLDPRCGAEGLKEVLVRAVDRTSNGSAAQASFWADGHLAMCSVPRGIPTLDEGPQPFLSPGGKMTAVFEGKVHNVDEIESRLGNGGRYAASRSGQALVDLFERHGEDFLGSVNGKFAFAIWDTREQRLVLGRDHLGVESLFYADQGDRFVFGSSLKAVIATGMVEKRLNRDAVLQYLLYCYNPDDQTFAQGVYKLPAGHTLSIDAGGISKRRYWRLSFEETTLHAEERYREEVLDLIRDAIRIRLDPGQGPGVFLSGGTDSSAIVSLTSGMRSEPIQSFSFRCQGPSYDESSYARFVADQFGTDHTEVSYTAERLSLVGTAVVSMDEPFCDIGIEMATVLLGRAAEGRVSYVFSGEGGDELFAGHPVYVADKVAAFVDMIPRGLTVPMARALQRIPDSDQKRNLQVKLKRFAYSLAFPPQLLSHRWRTYYTPGELLDLCSPDFVAECNLQGLFEVMARHTRDADGGDRLSRSLYSDYHTLVDFYLRRLALLRTFRIESRLPLLDYRLVEYAARIPSSLKIKGFSDTKYIYKKILEGIVPREILHDRPKLGHSVPMKNWMREEVGLKDWLGDVLSNGALRDSGFFRREYLAQMMDAHQRKVENHSHRLWGLAVLGLWLQQWGDW